MDGAGDQIGMVWLIVRFVFVVTVTCRFLPWRGRCMRGDRERCESVFEENDFLLLWLDKILY